ncbi:hypothetical protein FVE85_9471 [Porphyridium purpureum]|uniref:BZIP domain-containing protein n=1 Tax=Porphyridium purpureum TaxID=35688 RepID=A0A5J4YI74_PORPP|nr:hypothetical protein FVE85_9471 [Porphyridium purpureum]|eukprot:POR6230..scf261_15
MRQRDMEASSQGAGDNGSGITYGMVTARDAPSQGSSGGENDGLGAGLSSGGKTPEELKAARAARNREAAMRSRHAAKVRKEAIEKEHRELTTQKAQSMAECKALLKLYEDRFGSAQLQELMRHERFQMPPEDTKRDHLDRTVNARRSATSRDSRYPCDLTWKSRRCMHEEKVSSCWTPRKTARFSCDFVHYSFT